MTANECKTGDLKLFENFIDRFELAKALRVSPDTVKTWKHRGLIPFLQIGKTVRYDPKDVLEALRKRSTYVPRQE